MDKRVERLNESFRRSGLSQTELCEKTGITKGALSSYLSGRYIPKQEALEKLSHALNVPILYLMGLDADEKAPASELTPAEQSLLTDFRQLNGEGQEKVTEYTSDLVASGRYIKSDQNKMVEEA